MFVIKKRPPVETESQIVGQTNQPYQSRNNVNETSYLKYEDIPEEYRNSIVEKFITPIETKLNFTFEKLHSLGSKEALDIIKRSMSTINGNLKDISDNLDRIRLAEARAGIADLGLKGFEMSLKLDKGLQLDITPDSEHYEIFFNIVRKFIFKYGGSEWPPSINKYEYFKYDNPSKELCCFYWPLYGYIKTLFHKDFKGDVDLTDLFLLSKMRSYCKDFFPQATPQKKQEQKSKSQSQSRSQSGRRRRRGGDPPNRGRNRGRQGQQNRGRQGQQNRGRQGQQNRGKQGQQNKKTQQTTSSTGLSNKLISSNSQGCNPGKLSKVENSLKKATVALEKSNVVLSVDGAKVSTNEYDSLRQIVHRYIRSRTDKELIYGGKTVEEFIKEQNQGKIFTYPADDDSLEDKRAKCKNLSIGGSEPVILDPLTGTAFTYSNLQRWFNPKTKEITEQIPAQGSRRAQTKKHTVKYTDPCNYIPHCISKFQEKYPLPSPMWKLQQNELQGVRNRFMKLLTFLLVSLQKMYENIKRKNIGDFSKNEEMGKIQKFYDELLLSIEQERDQNKKQKMFHLRNSVEAKFGDILKK